MNKRDAERDYVKANRKGSRDAEIEMYGRPLTHRKVHRSKKTYDRKTEKAALKKLPFLLSASKTNALQFSGRYLFPYIPQRIP